MARPKKQKDVEKVVEPIQQNKIEEKELFNEEQSKDIIKSIVEKSGISDFVDVIYSRSPNLIVKDKFIQTQTIQASVNLKTKEYEDFKKYNLEDLGNSLSIGINDLSSILSAEYKKQLHKNAEKSYKNSYSKINKFLELIYKLFNKEYKKITKIKDSTQLIAGILHNSSLISNKKGIANFIVCGAKTVCDLQSSTSYVFSDEISLNTIPSKNSNANIYPIGKISNLNIFCDPYMEWSDNNIYIGRNTKKDEHGIVLVIYEKGLNIEVFNDIIMGNPKLLVSLRYAIVETQYNNSHIDFNKFEYRK